MARNFRRELMAKATYSVARDLNETTDHGAVSVWPLRIGGDRRRLTAEDLDREATTIVISVAVEINVKDCKPEDIARAQRIALGLADALREEGVE